MAEGMPCRCKVSQGPDSLVKVTKRKETPEERAARKKKEKEVKLRKWLEMTYEEKYTYAVTHGSGLW
jgi:hypothetical protein